jgi:hypothetical protein
MLFSYCRLIIFKSFKIESGWILGYMIGFRVGQVLNHLISSCLRFQIVDIGSSQISCGLGLDRIWDPLILGCLRLQVILSWVGSNQVPINLTFWKKSEKNRVRSNSNSDELNRFFRSGSNSTDYPLKYNNYLIEHVINPYPL